MSCGPRKRACTNKKFSHIHRSVIVYPKNTKFAVEVPAYYRKLHTKVEVKRTSCFRDTSEQSVSFCSSLFFLLCAKTQNMLRSRWNLAHVQGNQRQMWPDFGKSVLMSHFTFQIFTTKIRNGDFQSPQKWLKFVVPTLNYLKNIGNTVKSSVVLLMCSQ